MADNDKMQMVLSHDNNIMAINDDYNFALARQNITLLYWLM